MRRQHLTPPPDPRPSPASHEHGGPARRGRGLACTATHAAVAIAVAASTVLLAGCEVANRYVEVTLVNNTDQDLRIHVGQEPVASARAQYT